eukprot:555568_1
MSYKIWLQKYPEQIKLVPSIDIDKINVNPKHIACSLSNISQQFAQQDIPAFTFNTQSSIDTQKLMSIINNSDDIESFTLKHKKETDIENIDITETHKKTINTVNINLCDYKQDNTQFDKLQILKTYDEWLEAVKENKTNEYIVIKDTNKQFCSPLIQTLCKNNGLSDILDSKNGHYGGFDSGWLFLGDKLTGSGMHVENVGLHTLAILLAGKIKIWIIASIEGTKHLLTTMGDWYKKCRTPLAHKAYQVDPVWFLENGYDIYIVAQTVNQPIVLSSFAAHSTANKGKNMLETINWMGHNEQQRLFFQLVIELNKYNQCTWCIENSVDYQWSIDDKMREKVLSVINTKINHNISNKNKFHKISKNRKSNFVNNNGNVLKWTGSTRNKDKTLRQIYKCPKCPKIFDGKAKFDRHYLIHTGEQPFECDICGKKFNQKANMTTHRILHETPKPYQCTHCGKQYASRSGCTSHEKKFHSK